MFVRASTGSVALDALQPGMVSFAYAWAADGTPQGQPGRPLEGRQQRQTPTAPESAQPKETVYGQFYPPHAPREGRYPKAAPTHRRSP